MFPRNFKFMWSFGALIDIGASRMAFAARGKLAEVFRTAELLPVPRTSGTPPLSRKNQGESTGNSLC